MARVASRRLTFDNQASHGGAVLLGEVDRRLGLLDRLAACFQDRRDPERIEHSVSELVKQRVYAIALGYEDLNDHDQLHSDPLLALLTGKRDLLGEERQRDATATRNCIAPAARWRTASRSS